MRTQHMAALCTTRHFATAVTGQHRWHLSDRDVGDGVAVHVAPLVHLSARQRRDVCRFVL